MCHAFVGGISENNEKRDSEVGVPEKREPTGKCQFVADELGESTPIAMQDFCNWKCTVHRKRPCYEIARTNKTPELPPERNTKGIVS